MSRAAMVSLDVMLPHGDLASIPAGAARLEAAGFQRIYVAEGVHDPFILASVVSQNTRSVELGTDVAIALARNPMTVAYSAWDLQTLSGGRFVLGLGSQVRGHIVRRFSMPWSAPAARMREFVLALRGIWHAWEQGDTVGFEGEFYSHTRVGPPFSPGPNPFGRPRVVLAGVGPRMIQAVGEVADGFLLHPFHSVSSVSEVVVPALTRGRAERAQPDDDFEVVAQFMAIAADSAQDLAVQREAARAQVAFYASTPAYQSVLEDHDLFERLHGLSREGRWSEMAQYVSDELLERVAIIGHPDEVVKMAQYRAGTWADRILLMPPGGQVGTGVEATLAWYESLALTHSAGS